MTTWAKDNNGALQYASAAEFRGIPNWNTHETACRGKGYFPLVGEAEEREGYTAAPATWHTEQRSATRKELRREDPITHEPFMEPIYEEDPETHEMKKVGERQVEREVDIVLDKSYIQIDTWEYTPIPAPPPEPQPDTTARDNAEKAIVAAIKALADKYDAVAEIALLMYDGSLTIPALMELAGNKGVPEAELGALITELTPYKWQLEAVTGLLWAEAWEGLKSRFPAYWSELILDQTEQ